MACHKMTIVLPQIQVAAQSADSATRTLYLATTFVRHLKIIPALLHVKMQLLRVHRALSMWLAKTEQSLTLWTALVHCTQAPKLYSVIKHLVVRMFRLVRTAMMATCALWWYQI